MEAQHLCFFVSSTQRAGDMCPHTACRPELGYFFKQVVMCIEEERKSFGKNIYIKTFIYSSLKVGFSVSEGESQFLYRVGACLAYVIARYGNGIPLGYFLAA